MFQAFTPESFYQNSSTSTGFSGFADVPCPTQPPPPSFYSCFAPFDTSTYTINQFHTDPLYIDSIPVHYPQNTFMHATAPPFYVSSLPQSSHSTTMQPLTAPYYQTPLPFFSGCNPAQPAHFGAMELSAASTSLDFDSASSQYSTNITPASFPSPAPLAHSSVSAPHLGPQSPSTLSPRSPHFNSPHSLSAQNSETLGSAVPDSPRTSSPSHAPEGQQAQMFLGERQVSKAGKFNVMIYRIPGTTRSFTFFLAYKTKTHEVYRCCHCRKERKRRGEGGTGASIKVIGNAFLTDPCGMDHECNPAKYTEERGNRHVYKELQRVRSDEVFAEKKPVQIYLDMVTAPLDADDEDMEDGIRAAVRRSGYQARRRVIARSVSVWVNRSVSMESVPVEFRTLSDGSVFLHHQEPGFHIYILLCGDNPGVVFLPKPLIPQVRALRTPPVPEEHAAYPKCEEFLAYLRAIWMDGPFKDMWCKWKLEELRTTNLAEAFHRRLGLLIKMDHPPLSVLIDFLRKLNCEARAALKRLQEDPEDARALQKRDESRRAKIAEEMRNFEMIYQDGATQGQIEEYCMKMSRFVTNTAI